MPKSIKFSIKIFRSIALYPHTLWRMGMRSGDWIKRISRIPLPAFFFKTGIYLFFFLPVTLLLTLEVLILINETVVGEVDSYSFISDFKLTNPPDLVIPGPPSYDPVPLQREAVDQETYYHYLTEKYSPVVIQKLSYKPHFDIPLFIDFDGDLDPRNNPQASEQREQLEVGIYGEVTAETKDSYYITYDIYHTRDYDHPLRRELIACSEHDSDNEGLKIRVDKKTMRVVDAEAWYHNNFFMCNHTGVSQGTQPVLGRLNLENNNHIIVYVQSMGHGVRCAQLSDLQELHRNVKVIRYQGSGKMVKANADRSVQTDVTYAMKNMDDWYRYALAPLGKDEGGLFQDGISLWVEENGEAVVIGRFIAGKDGDINYWSRPKPPWSWDDPWDDNPIFVWHYFPSRVFAKHFGLKLSHEYLENRPVRLTFNGMTAQQVYAKLDLEVVKKINERDLEWMVDGDKKHLDRNRFRYILAFSQMFRRYWMHVSSLG